MPNATTHFGDQIKPGIENRTDGVRRVPRQIFNKILNINFWAIVSTVIAILISIVYLNTQTTAFGFYWSHRTVRYEVRIQSGLFLITVLRKYQPHTPFRCYFDDVETAKELEYFKTLPWWHGNNSLWERIGFTVEFRRRCVGFEFATGNFRPPFVWQHPDAPFEVYQVPLLAIVLIFLLPGIWIAFLRLRA